MLVIRLLRTGKKNQPFFRIVVTEKKNPPKGGRFVEKVGFWNPLTKERKIDGERVKYWISKGAQTSDTVHNFLIDEKIIEGKKIAKHKKAKKKPASEEEKQAEVKKPEEKPEEKAKVKEEPKEVKVKEKLEEKVEEKPQKETKAN